MLISNDDAVKRLNSSMNLCFNGFAGKSSPKLDKNKAMGLFVPAATRTKEINEQEVNEQRVAEEVKQRIEVKKEPNPFSKLVLLPSLPTEKENPEIESLLNNSEAQIKLGLAHDSALDILTNSIRLLSTKLDDVKAEKLPGVITAAAKVVEGIRKERNEASKNSKDREVHYHFYTPEQKKVSDYAVIDVG